jgi:hypothetical protein
MLLSRMDAMLTYSGEKTKKSCLINPVFIFMQDSGTSRFRQPVKGLRFFA